MTSTTNCGIGFGLSNAISFLDKHLNCCDWFYFCFSLACVNDFSLMKISS